MAADDEFISGLFESDTSRTMKSSWMMMHGEDEELNEEVYSLLPQLHHSFLREYIENLISKIFENYLKICVSFARTRTGSLAIVSKQD